MQKNAQERVDVVKELSLDGALNVHLNENLLVERVVSDGQTEVLWGEVEVDQELGAFVRLTGLEMVDGNASYKGWVEFFDWKLTGVEVKDFLLKWRLVKEIFWVLHQAGV